MLNSYEQVVIGSGFGGSVSALRLSEKGYSVLVLEQGLRREDKDYPKDNWDLKNTLWATKVGFKGPTQISMTSKVTILHGSGVGGGSQNYSNVHLIPPDTAFDSPAWTRIHDNWKQRLSPFYALAQRMLGTTKNPLINIADTTLRDVATDIGRGDSWSTVNTGIVFPDNDCLVNGNKVSQKVADPYFSGDGPERNTCNSCGSCNIGCRHNAKNTLMKNYLFFAERNGVEIRAESKVVNIIALKGKNGERDGAAGYELTVENPINRFFKKPYKIRCKGVVISAGVMGTVPLLLKMRDKTKTLPNISKWLGQQIRTNSETLLTANNMNAEVWEAPTITSKMSSSDDTTIEINRFRKGSDAAWLMLPNVPMIEGEGIKRFFGLLRNTILHPIKTFKILNPVGKAKNSVVFLVMQTKEAYIHLEWRRKWYRLFSNNITAVQKEGDEPLSVCFPSAEKVAKAYCEKLGGEPGNSMLEILLGTPVTAHIMSGVPIGTHIDNGVVDESGEVFGYQNLRVLDGSVIPGNLGVNPSLTITALSEYAMSKIPVYDQSKADQIKPIRFSKPLSGNVSSLTGEGVFKLRGQFT
ncbi:MAG: GMC family oxidoreductase [Gammaproteobacteria bacterium]|nr:GMC family oxidoreductase [Gammaproteobacteria bacterium]